MPSRFLISILNGSEFVVGGLIRFGLGAMSSAISQANASEWKDDR